MSETTYETVMRLLAEDQTQAQIAEAIGKSRQYVHQLVQRSGPPIRARHGTSTRAASCDCRICAKFKRSVDEAMPEVARRLRAGETLRKVTDMTGVPLLRHAAAGRAAIADGAPTVLAELVAVLDETAPLRSLGRPRVVKPAKPEPSRRTKRAA